MNSISTAKTTGALHEQRVTRSYALLIALLFATFILAYFPVWQNLVSAWSRSDEYSHGFLIIPLAVFITWRKKDKLSSLPLKPSSWGLVIAISGVLVYLVSYFAEILTLASLSLVMVLAGGIIYFYGFITFRELLFPLFLLLLMIPVPAQIYAKLTIPLQLFVSRSSTWLVAAFGLPIYREGNVIHLANRTFEVVRACSGLRSMISLLTLGAVFAYFTLRSHFLRTVLFFSAIPGAIFVNIVRVLLMVLVYHFFTYDLTTGTIHTVFGLVIFLLALAFLVGVRAVLAIWDSS